MVYGECKRNREGNETTAFYDAMNRRIGTMDVLWNTTTFDYDENGNLIGLTDPNSGSTLYEYDGNNRQTRLIRLACYYQLDNEEILNSRTKEVREARHVFVYMGNIYLNKSLTALGKLLRINQSAASQARLKGAAGDW